jgi:trimeric autotransporter adhesin
MNKVYRSVYNKVLGSWVAASELTAARGKPARAKSGVMLVAGALLASTGGMADLAHASVAISDNGMSTVQSGPASIGGSAGGKGASASANSIAMVGDGDCNLLTNTNQQSVYGDGLANNYNGGIYGFGVQTSAASYDDMSNAGAGQSGMKGFSSMTAGYVTETGNGVAQTQAYGLNSIAMGCGAQANGFGSVASGWGAVASGAGAMAYGINSAATGQGSLASGIAAAAAGDDSIAMGTLATASANGAIAFGAQSSAAGLNSVAMGANATASADNSVALGTGSVADRANTVSVGAAGAERQVTNVAAGTAATDAVNVSQMQNSGLIASDGTANVAVTYDKNADGTSNYSSLTLGNGVDGGTTIHNVAAGVADTDAVNVGQLNSAVNNMNSAVADAQNAAQAAYNPFVAAYGDRSTEAASASGVYSAALGANANASGTNSLALGAGANASANNSIALGANANASANNAVALGTGSVADRANSVSVGSAGNERQITNVAAGTQGTDAVNLNQLNAAESQAQNYTDSRISQSLSSLQNSVGDVQRSAYGGTAAAMAVAGLPQPTTPGKAMVAMAGSRYGGQTGGAIGVSYVTQNNKWVGKIAANTSSVGNTGVVVGAGYQW